MTAEIADPTGELDDLSRLGFAYAMLGDPHEAYRVYEELLALSRRIGNRQSEGKALINMGIAQSGIGNKAQAIGLVKQAVRIFEETNAPILADAREILTKLEGSQ